MKKIVIFYFFLTCFCYGFSQDTYTINGENLVLKTEERGGKIKLLSTKKNDQYRFFIKTKDGLITELTKADDHFKTVLKELTSDVEISMRRLKFTKKSIKNFISFYNYKHSILSEDGNADEAVNFRLGFSTGLTNNPFIFNPKNATSLILGGEFELYGDTTNPSHSGFLQARHSFSSDKFDHATTELSLGYRYRIIKKETFNIYIQNKFATLNFRKRNLPDTTESIIDLTEIKESEFNIPLIFGIGADIKISDHSFITLIYGELFALNQENNGNVSTDIAIGYKFNL